MKEEIPNAKLFARKGKDAMVWDQEKKALVPESEKSVPGEASTDNGPESSVPPESFNEKQEDSLLETELHKQREDEHAEAKRARNLELENAHLEAIARLKRDIPDFTDALRRLSRAIDRRDDLLEDPRRLGFLANQIEEIVGRGEISATDLENIMGTIDSTLRTMGTVRKQRVDTDTESLKRVLFAVRDTKEALRLVIRAVGKDGEFSMVRANLIRIDLTSERVEDYLRRKLNALDRYYSGGGY